MNCCSCRAVACFMPQAPHRDGCCSQHSSLWLQGSHAQIQLQLLPFLLSNRMQCLYHLSAMLIAMANTELASCCSQCSPAAAAPWVIPKSPTIRAQLSANPVWLQGLQFSSPTASQDRDAHFLSENSSARCNKLISNSPSCPL